MKSKFYALLVSAILITQAPAGGHHGGGGNFAGAGSPPPAGRGGVAPSFHSMPMQRFGSGPMLYSGQRFSSAGLHSPGSIDFRPHYVQSTGRAPIAARRFTPGNVNRDGTTARFSNAGNNARQLRSTNNLPPSWRNHVVAQHPANWHRDWNRHSDHWWRGHRCHFFNGSWFVFDLGFYPSWPYWYPYDYYGYGYPYPYGYDSGYYGASAYQGDGYYDGSIYPGESSNSIVSAVQQELAQQDYYRGQIDGTVGPETRRALARYQRSHGLRVTRGLTSDTIRSLGLRQLASY